VSASGETVIPASSITRGKEVFHLKGLMSWGSFWGDGADRGPDFTAEALHRTVVSMKTYYENELKARQPELAVTDQDAIAARVLREVRENTYDPAANRIVLNDAQVAAFEELNQHYTAVFTDPTSKDRFSNFVNGHISDPADLRALTGYFFWGGWASAANRPGETYSYTHNWPYDPDAGNYPTMPTLLWSFLSILALFAGAMLVLYVYGQMKELPGDPFNGASGGTLTTIELEKGYDFVRPTQRSTYKFFAFAIVLFLVQVLAGILSAEDFVGGGPGRGVVNILGIPLTFSITKAWHSIVQIYWFFMCWVGYTIFFLPRLSRVPKGQQLLINSLFALCVLVGAGALFGIYFGQLGYMSDNMSYWFGNQGWEFLELGRFWHVLMLVSFVLWITIIFRGVRPWITKQNMWSVPAWLFYGSGIMVLFLFFGLGATPSGNFAIADYWRWMTVHMWVEVTFEVFTTCIVAYLLVQMGLLNRHGGAGHLLAVMFLVLRSSAFPTTIDRQPTGIALGASSTTVLPLLLMTWMRGMRNRRSGSAYGPRQAEIRDGGVWLFVSHNLNIVGAGVFGSLINLPIVNYFEHGTYLTGNHAHAAMFGVKGNIAIGGMLFCCQHLFPRTAWNAKLINTSFWSFQAGLVLMMTLDLFPVGLYQMAAVVTHGFWYARTNEFVTGPVWVTLTWLRTIGGVIFLFGGVLPLLWFILSRGRVLVRELELEEGEWTVYDKDWAAHEEEIVHALE
jgi:nitric oxide reductase subunit B